MTEQVESLEFKAEVQQLLNILSRSLYTEREIFLRELISNASDALNRMQFEMLTNQDVLDPEVELAVHIDFDEEAKTLTISDTGIGMTREELIENLGTIAHSGAMAFLKKLEAEQRVDDIIGQFGVGFYAVFMVADEVHVTSRSYQPDAAAWTWSSRGDSTYTLQPRRESGSRHDDRDPAQGRRDRVRVDVAAGADRQEALQLRFVPHLRAGDGRQPADGAVAQDGERGRGRRVQRVLPPTDAGFRGAAAAPAHRHRCAGGHPQRALRAAQSGARRACECAPITG